MSLRKLLTLFIVLMALGTTSSWASCTRLSSPTVILDMVVGRVVVPPDLPVGSVILTRDWTMSAPGGASYRCTSGTNRFAAKIVSPGATDLGNKIYSTNVPGIGMRFSRGGATVNIVYPDVFSSQVYNTTNYSLEGSRFTLEIIKTAATTGSGTLAIAALKLGAAVAEGVDIDPVAVRTAGENAALNGVQDQLTVLVGDLSDKASGQYDIITANIVANAILSLAPAVPGLMADGAVFIASGIIDTRKDEVITGLEQAGLAVVEVKEKRGWECIVCKKA